MADDRTELLAEFIGPLRVAPGSKVKLATDFDPGYKAGFLKKKKRKDAATVPPLPCGCPGCRLVAALVQGSDDDPAFRQWLPGLQRIRAPYPIAAGIAAYQKHVRHHRR